MHVPTTQPLRVLVAGAGPTGLTAAVELRRQGIVPRIVDRSDGPTPLSKAVGISAHSLEILEPSGVTERLIAGGVKVRRVHVHRGNRRLGAVQFSHLHHRFNFLLALPQSDTESILADTLARQGVDVEWRTAVTGVRQQGEDVVVTLEGPGGPQETRFDRVFGADGVRSTVRPAIGQPFDGHTHEREWSIADAEMAEWPYEPETANTFLHPNGDVAFAIPIGPARYRVVSNTPDALAAIPGRFRLARLLRDGTFRIAVRQAPTYQVGRVFLGGDAAHVHSPVGGRGMNLGMEDAACFARRAATDALGGYTDERHPIGQRWIAGSERALAAAQSINPFVTALRDTALFVVGHLPPLQQPMLKRLSGLTE